MFSTFFALLALALPLVSADHGPSAKRHHDIAKRASGDVDVHKRFDGARFTFYDVGLGACGKTNVPSDFIVALNTDQYGSGYPGPHCFAMITITVGSKTTQAQIMDECPGCPYGGLDFSRGLFDFFADESVGVLTGSWYYNDGAGQGDSSTYQFTSTKKTSTSTTPAWTPTSTWEAPTTTSTKEKPSTTSTTSTKETPSTTSTTSTSTSKTSSSTSSTPTTTEKPSTSSTPTSTSSATPTSTAPAMVSSTPEDPEVINAMNQALMGLSGLLVHGAAN